MKLKKQKPEVKGCPECYRLMKSVVVNGRNVWVCVFCGIKIDGYLKQ